MLYFFFSNGLAIFNYIKSTPLKQDIKERFFFRIYQNGTYREFYPSEIVSQSPSSFFFSIYMFCLFHIKITILIATYVCAYTYIGHKSFLRLCYVRFNTNYNNNNKNKNKNKRKYTHIESGLSADEYHQWG